MNEENQCLMRISVLLESVYDENQCLMRISA